jgi:nicotinamidase-related amidase
LIVVDMQNDFVDGSLGTPEAQRIVDHVVEKIMHFEGRVLFTQDTHESDYLETQEGVRLPVEHCIRGTKGWELVPAIEALLMPESQVIEKPTFGSSELVGLLERLNEEEPIRSITLAGLCTDICVISNALLIKAYFPEIPIAVDATCCAGVTVESHQRALDAMRVCQIDIVE